MPAIYEPFDEPFLKRLLRKVFEHYLSERNSQFISEDEMISWRFGLQKAKNTYFPWMKNELTKILIMDEILSVQMEDKIWNIFTAAVSNTCTPNKTNLFVLRRWKLYWCQILSIICCSLFSVLCSPRERGIPSYQRSVPLERHWQLRLNWSQ